MGQLKKSKSQISQTALLDKSGRVLIPAEYRRQLGLKPGDELLVRIQDGEIHLSTFTQMITQAQAMVAKYTEQRNLSQELLTERKEAATRE